MKINSNGKLKHWSRRNYAFLAKNVFHFFFRGKPFQKPHAPSTVKKKKKKNYYYFLPTSPINALSLSISLPHISLPIPSLSSTKSSPPSPHLICHIIASLFLNRSVTKEGECKGSSSGCPIGDFLERLGLRLKPKWLDACLDAL